MFTQICSVVAAKIFSVVVFSLLVSSCSTSVNNEPHSKSRIKEILRKVADRQLADFEYAANGDAFLLHDYGIDSWTNAVLYLGMSSWSKVADDEPGYTEWLNDIGDKCGWALPNNFCEYPEYGIYHADELCVGQFYLDMYELYGKKEMITSTCERVRLIVDKGIPNRNLSNENKQAWSWCDALFMAPPVYGRVAAITGDEKYLRFMDEQFKNTVAHLYSKTDSLFFRDDGYLHKKEQNGEKIFWGRGNGWVVAGLVNLLKTLAVDSPYRSFYEDLFKEQICKLAKLQNPDGFWRASLLDPESYPSPETSATALIAYSIAYGIKNNLLEKGRYYPVLTKAWDSLVSAVDENGKLGWVQPIGADPKKVTKEMTSVYGVGTFLLAGSEIYKLVEN
jgi:rhamnogalacturonyl hydrolase YesR